MPRRGWVSLVLASCTHPAAAPPPPPAPTKIEIPGPTASTDPDPSPAVAAPVVPEVREPANAACRIAEKAWSVGALRLTEGGASFGQAVSAPTTLVLPAGQPRAPTAVLEDAMVIVRARIDPSDARVFPRTRITLGGYLVTKPNVSFQWLGGAAGRLRLGVDATAVLSEPQRVEADVSCDALGLNTSQFTARDLITQRTNLPEKRVARDGVGLALERGGAAVARLKAGGRVEIVEVHGADSKILYDGDGYFVFGWVPSADLHLPPVGIGHGIGLGRLGRRYSSSHRGRTCARDLSLLIEVGSERALVGTVKKGASFLLVEEGAPATDGGEPPARGRRTEPRYQRIALPLVRWLLLDDKARLLIPEDEWKECAAPP